MEERLKELFPDETVSIQEYHSYVNQPERIQISSQQDINDYDPRKLTTYFNFRVPLPRPALNVKSLQLARASIPNAVPSIPDQETTFWFYALPYEGTGTIRADNAGVPGDLVVNFTPSGTFTNAVGVPVAGQIFFEGSPPDPSPTSISGLFLLGGNFFTYNSALATAEPFTPIPCYAANNDIDYWITFTSKRIGTPKPSYLRYIRFLPSWSPADLLDDGIIDTWPVNRVFDDYEDLVSWLNIAVIVDPLMNFPSNAIPGTFKFVPNLLSFSYSQTYKKIIMTGNNNYPEAISIIYHYMPAPSDDPNWIAAAAELAQRDEAAAGQPFVFNEFGVSSVIQPYTPYRNLNTRIGFTYPIFPTNIEDYNNMIRPHPALETLSNVNVSFDLEDHLAPGYPDLANTACVLLYTDVTGGSTIDTVANRALLASIPMNTPTLGIGFHSLPLNNPLTKIPTQINEIYIEMRTDSGEPFYLPNNAIVSCEFILTY